MESGRPCSVDKLAQDLLKWVRDRVLYIWTGSPDGNWFAHPQQLTPDNKRVRQCSEQMPWIRPDSPNPLHFSNVRWPTFWRGSNRRPYGGGIDWNQRRDEIWCGRLHQQFKPWLLIQWTQPFVTHSPKTKNSGIWVLPRMTRHWNALNCLSKSKSRRN